MLPALTFRLLRTVKPRALWKLAWNAGVKGTVSIERFKRRLRHGEYFPPFLHFSITNRCNLRCQGCWVDVESPVERIDAATLNRSIGEAKACGNSIFGILGGEPLMHPELFCVLEAHPDCYFQVFSNGHFISQKVAARFARIGNVSPLISIEGLEAASDERRGGQGVLNKSLRGLNNSIAAGLFTGVATSLCQTNIDDLLSETWLRRLIGLGVHYVWYYAYRPVGPKPNQELALRPDQLLRMRQFIVEMRCRTPLIIIETYYDHLGRALCPMATGLSHHVGPRGDIEPCPVIQLAAENIRQPGGLFNAIAKSAFLADLRRAATGATRGCVVLERPELIAELARKHGAHDSSLRGTVLAEMTGLSESSAGEVLGGHFSQWLPGHEVAEKHWVYRLAKKFWFNDFGAYSEARHDTAGRAAALNLELDRHMPGRNTSAAIQS